MLYLFAALSNGRDTSGGVVVCASPTGRRRVAIRRPDPVRPLDGYDIMAEANGIVAAAWPEERA